MAHATFAACIDLRVGVELDVRRTRDGQFVCTHDSTVNRTTTGTVSELSLRELRQFDAGTKFDPLFTGERVPTLECRASWRNGTNR
jgi:glycerophosphoryl diester phosphodiesterase